MRIAKKPIPHTVGSWRRRFLARRLDGLLDAPRPGGPRRITDRDVERVVRKTLEESPKDATHWSTRSMAKATGLSQTAIVRIWHAFGLQPHRVETFKISPDPLFVEKVRDKSPTPSPNRSSGRKAPMRSSAKSQRFVMRTRNSRH